MTTTTRRARTLSPQAYALWEWLSRTRNRHGFARVALQRCANVAQVEAGEVQALMTELQLAGLVTLVYIWQGVIVVRVTDPARVARTEAI